MKRFSIGAMLAFSIIVLSATSMAATGNLSVQRSVDIDAPPAKVWSVIKNFDTLTWIHIVKTSSATNGNTVGSIRTLDLGGPQLTEALAKYDDPGMTYTYTIQDTPTNKKVLPVRNYESTLTVKPGTNGGSTVTWSGTFDRLSPAANPPPDADDAAAVNAIGGVYDTGLADLKAKTAM